MQSARLLLLEAIDTKKRDVNVTVGDSKVLFEIKNIKMKSSTPPAKFNLFSRDFTLESIVINLNPPIAILHTSFIEKCIDLVNSASTSALPIFSPFVAEIDSEEMAYDFLEECLLLLR